MEKASGTAMSKAEQLLMRKVERENVERVQKLRNLRRANIRVGGLIGASVIGVYIYTMYAVRNENIFDDFVETPPKQSS